MINDFKKTNTNTSYYDLFEDYALIESSFAQQYGIRLRQEDDMSWDEFTTLLSGLNPKTPLGAMVSIRSESDPEMLKHFTPEQKRINREWREKQAQKMSKEEYKAAMDMFSNIFKSFN